MTIGKLYQPPVPAPVPTNPVKEDRLADDRPAIKSGRVDNLIARFETAAASQGVETQKAPTKQQQAAHVQREAGVLASHALNLQKTASDENICICIRYVNPMATGLIEAGYGTKDISIHGKSSNLPPLNAFIPVDQSLGKKGGDPEAVVKYNAENQQAIADKVATKVPAEIPADRIKFLARELPTLEIHGSWLNMEQGEGVMIGTDFISDANPKGQQVAFWGVKDGDIVTVYRAHQEQSEWIKGELVELMGNRHGKAVTADYDLAMVSPHMRDYGPEHTMNLKVATYEEAVDLRLVKPDDEHARRDFFQRHVSQALEETAHSYSPIEDLDGYSETWLNSQRLEIRRLSLLEVEGLVSLEDLTSLKSDNDQLLSLEEAYLAHNRDELVQEGKWPEKMPQRSMGITSKYVEELVPRLNTALGCEHGKEVFQHGPDSGNPFSAEADNYPMTTILPDQFALEGETIRVTHNADEFAQLVKELKDAGYQVPINHRWTENKDLLSIRSDRFLNAQSVLKEHFNEPV